MSSRRRSREHALQILYSWDMRQSEVEDALDAFYKSLNDDERAAADSARDSFAEQLVRGTVAETKGIDERILAHSENWRIERMPVVDRNILRLAIYEMTREGTPYAVVIDEALELARRYSNEESVSFVNGVLDAIRRGLEQSQSEVLGE